MDGFFQSTIAPSILSCRSYYLGLYASYGYNCQSCGDGNHIFLFFGVVASGSTNDSTAFNFAVELRDVVENLPEGLYLVGDAAYEISEKILIPFTGSYKDNPDNDAFNFYSSEQK